MKLPAVPPLHLHDARLPVRLRPSNAVQAEELRKYATTVCYKCMLRWYATNVFYKCMLQRSATKVCYDSMLRRYATNVCYDSMLQVYATLRRYAMKSCYNSVIRASEKQLVCHVERVLLRVAPSARRIVINVT
jgi:hypothetical protein